MKLLAVFLLNAIAAASLVPGNSTVTDKRITRLQAMLAETNKKLQSLERDGLKRTDEMTKAINKVKHDLKASNAKVTIVKPQAPDSENARLKMRIASLKHAMDMLRNDVSGIRTRVGTLEHTLSNAKANPGLKPLKTKSVTSPLYTPLMRQRYVAFIPPGAMIPPILAPMLQPPIPEPMLQPPIPEPMLQPPIPEPMLQPPIPEPMLQPPIPGAMLPPIPAPMLQPPIPGAMLPPIPGAMLPPIPGAMLPAPFHASILPPMYSPVLPPPIHAPMLPPPIHAPMFFTQMKRKVNDVNHPQDHKTTTKTGRSVNRRSRA